MKKLLEIPVLGKILRIIASFLKAPERFDALFAAVHKDNVLTKALVQELEAQNLRITGMENADPEFIKQILSGVQQDHEGMMALNRSLSSCPTVWGDSSKLHISPNASVHSCLFNTNSGHITVGAFTFAGSRVSILAGSHDPRLRGSLRRDADYKEGCDITIGEGVWLASGCTVLGPCTIGDNAIIAAGAVVIPGTDVPPDTLYGGVPARLIRKLDTSEATEHGAISEGLKRNEGFLFVSGWSQRLYGFFPFLVYKMLEPEALVYTNQVQARLSYCLVAEAPVTLTVVSADEEKDILLDNEKGEILLQWQGEPGRMMTLLFRRKSGEGDVFLALLPA